MTVTVQRKDVIAGLLEVLLYSDGIIAATKKQAPWKHPVEVVDFNGRPGIADALLAKAQAYATLVALGAVE